MAVQRSARQLASGCRAFVFLWALSGALGGAADAQTKSGAAAGRVSACESCHGTAQRPPAAGTPSLAGQQREFLVVQMFFFREGLREVPQMAGMFKGMDDGGLTELAKYFAAQKPLPPPAGKPDSRRLSRGAALAASLGCGSCHLGDYSGQNQVPRISNQREDYLVAAMKDYRDNRRSGTDTSMNSVLYQVPDADIQALAHHLAHYTRK